MTKKTVENTVTLDFNAAKGENKDIGGSVSDDFNLVLFGQVCRSMWTANSDAEMRKKQDVAAAMAMIGIGPKDELEGMMVAQLIASHNAAMECYRRAMISEQTFEGRRENLTETNKLSRTHAALVEALNRHRGKGQQKVTVEHVHGHAGGQAVVGVVEQGGGAGAEIKGQPHAKQVADASIPALRGEDADGLRLSVSGNAERSMPDARGKVVRRAKGK